ncbi:MFS transporter [Asticcacaulis solisilvae]|uniref:MFS transporter n=1 Tax=Asticcacaulis solisilvae TaxID=1217274 RepID=UPI003FD72D36
MDTQAHAAPTRTVTTNTVLPVILAVAFCHLLNDMMQALLPAIYPNLKVQLGLSFTQIGIITLAYQITGSILQPLVGLYADKRPTPLALPGGTLFTLAGLVVLSMAHAYPLLLIGASLLGMGSSVFHPESSRVVRMAAGERAGLGQSLFQVGGNAGSALGPLLAAIVVVRWGQGSLAVLSLTALLSCAILWQVGTWYRHHGLTRLNTGRKAQADLVLPKGTARRGIFILLAMIFSKYVYLASMTSYLTFYLIHRFGVGVGTAQLYLFGFLGAVAVGTFAGGPIGDRIGRKYVIWASILGILPFTLLLPHVPLVWVGVLSLFIGAMLASAFPAIVVLAQELMPGKVGMISGLFFGFAFGVGGIGAAVLGRMADAWGIDAVFTLCSVLPAIGLLAAWLPDVGGRRR